MIIFVSILLLLLMIKGIKNNMIKRENKTNDVIVENISIVGKKTKLEIEYSDSFTREIKQRLSKKIESSADIDNMRNMLIWKIQKVFHIKSYDDIVPRLLQMHKEKNYEGIMSLLDTLEKLNVDTEEILDDNPQLLNDIFDKVSFDSANRQVV